MAIVKVSESYLQALAELAIKHRDQRDRLREKVIDLNHTAYEERPTAEEIESMDTDPDLMTMNEHGPRLQEGDMTAP